MDVRKIDDELHNIFDLWIKKHGEVHKDMDSLPRSIMGQGYMSFIDGVPTTATFVYNTPVVAWFAWTAANPDVRGDKRDQGFFDLFQHVSEILKNDGVVLMFAGVTNNSLLKRFYDQGFTIANYDNVHVFKVLE
jgi:hypothetical protein